MLFIIVPSGPHLSISDLICMSVLLQDVLHKFHTSSQNSQISFFHLTIPKGNIIEMNSGQRIKPRWSPKWTLFICKMCNCSPKCRTWNRSSNLWNGYRFPVQVKSAAEFSGLRLSGVSRRCDRWQREVYLHHSSRVGLCCSVHPTKRTRVHQRAGSGQQLSDQSDAREPQCCLTDARKRILTK